MTTCTVTMPDCAGGVSCVGCGREERHTERRADAQGREGESGELHFEMGDGKILIFEEYRQ